MVASSSSTRKKATTSAGRTAAASRSTQSASRRSQAAFSVQDDSHVDEGTARGIVIADSDDDGDSHAANGRAGPSGRSNGSATPGTMSQRRERSPSLGVPEERDELASSAIPQQSRATRDLASATPPPSGNGYPHTQNGSQDEDGEQAGRALRPEDERDEDCIKILVATDNHIGYNERDPVRGRDSIETFREILQLAKANDVDMLLLAGDLFHENKPSRASLHQTVALLREYCMGSRPIALEIISDAGVGLQTGYDFPPINYEDENYNIALPVFSIHGNHDDPQGAGPEGALCALDLLSASGLVNYFGRQELPGEATTDEEARESGIQVKPILLRKGETNLAMYGVGNIRDERFHAEMRKNRISMFRPSENANDWFNLLLIHQNRVAHGPKSSVPENGFGDEVDLIIWGHEHDCRIDPEPVTGKAYYISQPGSSVATSLSMGESIPKHVGLLTIQGRDFSMQKLRLRTVRPFVMDEVRLSDVQEIESVQLDNKVQVTKYLKQRVNDLIKRANEEWDELYADEEHPPEKMLPLIRLRVEYSNHEVGNPQRFGQDFTNKVANPRDIILFSKRKQINRNGKKVTIDQPEGLDPAQFGSGELPERIEKIRVETLVRQYLEAQTLLMLHENGIGHAVNAYVEKDDKHAIEAFISKTLEAQRKSIEKAERNEENGSDEEIEAGMQNAKNTLAQEFEERTGKKTKGKQRQEEPEEEEAGSDHSDFGRMSLDGSDGGTPAVTGKKGAAKSTAASKGKGKKSLFQDDSAEEEEDASRKTVSKKPTAPAKAAAAKPTAGRKTAAKSTQSQLSFAPARSTASRTATSSRSKKASRANSDNDDDEEDNVMLDDVESEDERPTKTKAPTRKR